MIVGKRLAFVLFALVALTCTRCKKSSNNRYDLLSNNNIGWQDVTDEVNGGADQPGTLKRYYFLRNGDFRLDCEASDASCLINNAGTWTYITNTNVQVSIDAGPILFYNIVKIDATDLWLQDNNTKNKQVLRKLVPYH